MLDYLEAVRLYLQAAPSVTDICKPGHIVASDHLPDWLVPKMPKAAILIMAASGGQAIGGPTNDFSDKHIDVRCYHFSLASAREFESTVFDVLRRMRRNVQGDVLLHFCRAIGSPINMRVQAVVWPGGVVDKTTHWPYVQRPWQLLSADVPAVVR